MFRSNATVNYVGTTLQGLPYAEAEFVTNTDLEHAELELGDESLHSSPLEHVKAGRHIFEIYGGHLMPFEEDDTIGGNPMPFKVDDTIEVLCWPKGEFPTGIDEHKER